jgi:hypothetical protein
MTAQIDAPVIFRLARKTIPHSAGSRALKSRRLMKACSSPAGTPAHKINPESKRAGAKIQYAGPGLAAVRGAGSCTLMCAPVQHIEFLEKQKLPLVTNARFPADDPGGCQA